MIGTYRVFHIGHMRDHDNAVNPHNIRRNWKDDRQQYKRRPAPGCLHIQIGVQTTDNQRSYKKADTRTGFCNQETAFRNLNIQSTAKDRHTTELQQLYGERCRYLL